MSITVKSGIPEIFEVEAEAHWEVSETHSRTQTHEESKDKTKEIEVTVPPRKILTGQYKWWDSQVSIKYTA